MHCRRVARLLLVCIVLGFASSIAVAWALRIYSFKYPPAVPPQIYKLTDDRTEWDIQIAKGPGTASLHYVARVDLASGWGMMYNSDDEPTPIPLPREPRWAAGPRAEAPSHYTIAAFGWPLLCLKHETIRPKAFPQAPRTTETWIAPAWLGPLAGTPFPVAPIAVGLAVNTVAWGAAWWLMFAGTRAARRARRRSAGRCINCGYDLAGSPQGCPECGTSPR